MIWLIFYLALIGLTLAIRSANNKGKMSDELDKVRKERDRSLFLLNDSVSMRKHVD